MGIGKSRKSFLHSLSFLLLTLRYWSFSNPVRTQGSKHQHFLATFSVVVIFLSFTSPERRVSEAVACTCRALWSELLHTRCSSLVPVLGILCHCWPFAATPYALHRTCPGLSGLGHQGSALSLSVSTAGNCEGQREFLPSEAPQELQRKFVVGLSKVWPSVASGPPRVFLTASGIYWVFFPVFLGARSKENAAAWNGVVAIVHSSRMARTCILLAFS